MSSTTEPVPENEPEVSDIDKLRTALETAKAEAAEHIDRFLRAKAEADNVRKRTEAEIANIRKYAVESFAAEMLAVHDSLDLARSVSLVDSAVAVDDSRDGGGRAASGTAAGKMHEGLGLTLKLMDGVLAKFGVTPLDPKGEKFDPARHQALSMVESAEVAPNHIVTVVQKGYLLRDRLLRPAMVLVARAPAAEAPGNT
ncbi:MAG: nucleotide exchange factor GrpE [Candidatus Muproteobacteria bacterium RBG_16_64_10]|uniref:Protein GrpE n=1 Tax=Candidatus Muproteobacteria bacterium RBG_16_64_10 TaxID=1817757 RepID=A0A1F6T746_9PROT|nr:MAG: nucleotide exchange factor GrpE [Candidatus Muproteobacteria bacterium RBG_16_64_10]